jgi:Fe-S-cluster containining protein
MDELAPIHSAIEGRVAAIRSAHPEWLCAKGCDTCCRRLAALPRLSGAEWALLRPALAALPAARLAQIGRAVAAAGEQSAGPVVCPLLDRSTGACPVYAQRPVACRSYGFYVQRDLGLYCRDIEGQVADGQLADVVWGNHDVVDRQLAELGDARPLDAWFACWAAEESGID